jgi:cardiolipin synthase
VNAVLRQVPNMLSALRLAAAPVTAGLLLNEYFQAAFGVFALAGLSDALDGYLARRFDLRTRLGRYLDAIADKALMLAVFVALASLHIVPLWLTLMIIGRDVFILLGVGTAWFAGAPLVVEPLLIGKISTVLQVLYVGLHVAQLAFGWPPFPTAPFDSYVLAAVTMASALSYATVWWQAMRAMPKTRETQV